MHGDRELALVSLALLVAAGCTPANMAISAGAWVGAAAVEERGVGGFAGDTMLKLRIHDLLGQRRFSYLTDVNVAVSENRVMLTGTVPTTDARTEVVAMVRALPEVRALYDELQVTSGSNFRDTTRDMLISTKLRTRLFGDKAIADVNYDITTVNGTVYLLGIAQSGAEIDRVVAHVRDISGVRAVVNHVMVKSDPDRYK
ncbi:MAG: BON domain-containing protein [Alphaproteobacteria bacterium]|nr:BON domain-containing protein [Alphaproteobacteria bacterium]